MNIVIILHNYKKYITPQNSGFFIYIKQFIDTLTNYNKNIEFTLKNNSDFDYDLYDKIIIFTNSLHLKIPSNIKNKKYILINSESLRTSYGKIIINNINEYNYDIVYDYVDTNIEILNKQNIKSFKLFPGYSKYTESLYINNDIKNIDILFYGYLNKRRKNILNKFKKLNINIKCVSKFKNFDEQIKYIASSKIILIIMSFDNDRCIDHYRLSLLLSNKSFIVYEEPIIVDENDISFTKNIVCAKQNDIHNVCMKWLNKTQTDRNNKAIENYNYYKKNYGIQKYYDNILYNFS